VRNDDLFPVVKVIELESRILRSYKGNTSYALGVSALSDGLLWGICVWDVLIRGTSYRASTLHAMEL
jgi:hypothetical protein